MDVPITPLDELLGKEDDESQAETTHDEGEEDIQGDPSLSTPAPSWGAVSSYRQHEIDSPGMQQPLHVIRTIA